MKYTEETLKSALVAAHVKELPQVYKNNDKGRWIFGIALVEKVGCPRGYVLVRHGGDNIVRVMQDFGIMSPIKGIINIYPYLYLDEERFLHGMTEEKKEFLLRQHCKKDVYSLSSFEKEAILVDIAIEKQLHSTDIDRLQDELKTKTENQIAESRDVFHFETIANSSTIKNRRKK